MKNIERQRSLEKKRLKEYGDISACGCEVYCAFCREDEIDDRCCCAKAYNRMMNSKVKGGCSGVKLKK